jgi:hypothetical protein
MLRSLYPGGWPVNLPFITVNVGARRPTRTIRRKPTRRPGRGRHGLARAGLGLLVVTGATLAGVASWLVTGGDPSGLALLTDEIRLLRTANAEIAGADEAHTQGVPLRVTTQPEDALRDRGSQPPSASRAARCGGADPAAARDLEVATAAGRVTLIPRSLASRRPRPSARSLPAWCAVIRRRRPRSARPGGRRSCRRARAGWLGECGVFDASRRTASPLVLLDAHSDRPRCE